MPISSSFNMKRRRVLGLVLVAGAIGTVGWRQLASAPPPEGTWLEVTEAHRKLQDGDLLLIDIRRPDEWARTGVPLGAHPLDMRRDDFIAALTAIAGDDRDRPIALICARGVRSARLGRQLAEAGFSTIIDVPEGMLGSAAGPGWLARNLPTDARAGS